MKNRIFILLISALMLITFTACSQSDNGGESPAPIEVYSPPPEPAPEPEQPPEASFSAKTLRLSDAHPDGYPTVMGDLKFAELVGEMTDGAWKIEVYNNGKLGSERSVVAKVQEGTIDFARVGTGTLGRIAPEMNIFSLPYLFRDAGHMFSVLDGSIGESFLNRMYNDGLLGLCWFDAGTRGFYNIEKEIRTPSDIEGLKIRVQDSEPLTAFVAALGAEPSHLPYNEILSGLSLNELDGAEGNELSFYSAMHSDAAKFYTKSEHIRIPEMIIVNTTFWESLSPEEQIMIKQCALEAAHYERGEWQKQEEEYARLAGINGVTVTVLSPEELELFADASKSVYDLNFFKDFKSLIENIKNVQ